MQHSSGKRDFMSILCIACVNVFPANNIRYIIVLILSLTRRNFNIVAKVYLARNDLQKYFRLEMTYGTYIPIFLSQIVQRPIALIIPSEIFVYFRQSTRNYLSCYG